MLYCFMLFSNITEFEILEVTHLMKSIKSLNLKNRHILQLFQSKVLSVNYLSSNVFLSKKFQPTENLK